MDSASLNYVHGQYYWAEWVLYIDTSGYKLDLNGSSFPDYLDTCLWNEQRLGYLGLPDKSKMFLDPYSQLPKKNWPLYFR
jgi:hypothetical protein